MYCSILLQREREKEREREREREEGAGGGAGEREAGREISDGLTVPLGRGGKGAGMHTQHLACRPQER